MEFEENKNIKQFFLDKKLILLGAKKIIFNVIFIQNLVLAAKIIINKVS